MLRYAAPVVTTRSTAQVRTQEPVETLTERIARVAPSLTASERRVAETLLGAGALAAFGTVAQVAQAAGSGAATVVRTAGKLGFDGFSALQAAARREVADELGPAAQRIHHAGGEGRDLIRATLDVEVANLRQTFESLDDAAVEALADELSDLRYRVTVLAGEAATGIGAQLARDLAALRPDVVHVSGNEVAVSAHVAQLAEGDLLVVIDLRRYDRWLLDTVEQARSRGLRLVVLTDSVLSPLAGGAQWCLVVAAAAAGPFDSYVGALALGNLVVAATAQRLRRVAGDRLTRAEAAWQRTQALIDP
jgi:DNA-binding MurR/RpiR family transcriptional regulator